MHIRKKAFILASVTLMSAIIGCSNNSSQSNAGKENNNKILGITNEIRKITSSQLTQLTKDMTYRKVINTLGNTKDIGSGISIFRYEYENGEFLDIKMFEQHLDARISEEVYQYIQTELNNKMP
ncbi:hypothetical protein [Paenibacillus pini]|uniref:Lipoprotein n=1 Tax=Paenibacillus pini JCM 16418 TaxID=1236976 RepID=W7YAI2_9BACL|nr:hypothetical protein [Paenibacillus pini]GAF08055.1 hypothetical protein JCM16418_2092 [Paenibacillus pini JCM 16418]